ncbi:hypothetical protein C6500_15425 [Candidatus Poribacteria bacterium]|nr:MAG: hypothetical protein C6500_15425 [Candidatus Poribacteria bacterium]
MKKTHLFSIVCFLLSSLLLRNSFAQDFAAQWHLPEGAKARLGRGRLINIKLSPDSTRVVASTPIGIWIYDAQTGEVVSLFTETQIGEEALTFSPDASIVATAHGNSIYVWDTFTGNAFAMLEEHPDSVNAITLSPDGTKLAVAGGDWTVRLWKVNTGKYINSLTGHPSAVNAVAFSPDGNILASAGSTLRLWDANTGESLHTDSRDLGSIDLLVFSPDGKTLATGGGWDHTVHLWNVNTGTLRTGLKGHTDKIRDIAFSPDSKTLITASRDKTMRLWDASTGTEQKNLPTPDDAINPIVAANRMLTLLEQGILPKKRDDVHSVKFSQDGTQLISVSSDGSLHLWDVDTGRYQFSFSVGAHTHWVSTLAFSADSKYLISNTALEGRARVWSIETFTQHALLTVPQEVIDLTFPADLTKLAGRTLRHGIQVWDSETKAPLSTLEGTPRKTGYWPLVFSPDGTILAGSNRAGALSNKVELWESDTGGHLFTLEGGTGAVSRYTFSPHRKVLASGDADGTIALWDTETGENLSHLTGHTKRISALTFSADSKTLASGGGNEIRLWEVNTGNPIGTFDTVESITALAFSPDGKTLANGSEAGLIQIWKSDPDYQIQGTLKGHQASVGVLMFSPDGKTLASGSYDGTILLWDWETFK